MWKNYMKTGSKIAKLPESRYSETCDVHVRPAYGTKFCGIMTGSLLSEVQIHWNDRHWYFLNGLSSEVGLSSQWSFIAGFTEIPWKFTSLLVYMADWKKSNLPWPNLFNSSGKWFTISIFDSFQLKPCQTLYVHPSEGQLVRGYSDSWAPLFVNQTLS